MITTQMNIRLRITRAYYVREDNWSYVPGINAIVPPEDQRSRQRHKPVRLINY